MTFKSDEYPPQPARHRRIIQNAYYMYTYIRDRVSDSMRTLYFSIQCQKTPSNTSQINIKISWTWTINSQCNLRHVRVYTYIRIYAPSKGIPWPLPAA